jgi:histidinol dehydrogenase
MRMLRVGNKEFKGQFERVLSRGREDLEAVEGVVRAILEGVRRRGDKEVMEYTKSLDGVDI